VPGVALKKLKNELRVSKKAEQLAKEKLINVKKQLDKTQTEYAKYKQETEGRVDGLKAEISLLQAQLHKSIADASDQLERMSQGSGFEGSVGTNNPDVMKIIEDYSK
jgi:hypothetical protein